MSCKVVDIIDCYKLLNLKKYFVYILTNFYHSTLYTGVTNDLVRRCFEHRLKENKGFTKKYQVSTLVYYQIFDRIEDAIFREKQIKNLVRRKKLILINEFNPTWKDMFDEINPYSQ